MTKEPSFNLVEQPWIDVIDNQGCMRSVGLRELFLHAHNLCEIVDQSPLSLFSTLRLLWVISHRIVDGPRTLGAWRRNWKDGHFETQAVERYFAKWFSRFDLFDRDHPFFQVAEFETFSGKNVTTNPAARLLHELASGNNATLFDHSVECEPVPFAPAAVARALLVAQTFGLGGGKGPTARWRGVTAATLPYASHAPCAGAVLVYVGFDTLYQTLVGNLPRIGPEAPFPFTSGPNDVPGWERATPRAPEEAAPDGYLDLCTWPARYVRLLPNAEGQVYEMCIGQGAVVDKTLSQSNPYAMWRRDKDGQLVPQPLHEQRAIWRSSVALFALTESIDRGPVPFAVAQLRSGRLVDVMSERAGRPLPLVCVGLANDKANALLWRKEIVPAAAQLLDGGRAELLEAALLDIQVVYSALYSALFLLGVALLETEGKSADTAEVSRVRKRFESKLDFWARMEPEFHTYLRSLGGSLEAAERAHLAWLQAAMVAADDGLVRACGFAEGNLARVGKALARAKHKLRGELAPLRAKIHAARIGVPAIHRDMEQENA